MKIKLLFFLLISFVYLYSQKTTKDLQDSIFKYYYTDVKKAKYFSKKLTHFSEKNGDKFNVSYSYVFLANLNVFSNHRDSTKFYFNKAKQYAKKNNDIETESIVLLNELNFYINCYDFNKSLSIIEYTLSLMKNTDDPVTYATLMTKKAVVFFELERYEEARKLYLQNLKIKEIRRSEQLLNELGLARCNFKLKLFDNYLNKINQNIEECSANKLFDLKIYFLIQKANYLIYLKKIDESIILHKQIISEVNKVNINYIVIYPHIEFAKTYILAKQYAQSIELLKGVLNRYKLGDISQESQTEINFLLAESYKNIKNYEKSNHHFQEFVKLSQKIGLKKINAIDGLRKIDIEELKEKEKNANQMKQLYFILMIVLLVVLLVFIYLRIRSIKKDRIKFEALYQKIQAFENHQALEKDLPLNIVRNIYTEPSNEENITEESNLGYIEEEKVKEIMLNLKKIEESKLFLKTDFSLVFLAKKLKTNTAYLSKIINTELGKSFSNYVNDLRINYIILELKNNKKLRSYSTQAIAEELGYKTVVSFTKYFKDATGISPSTYIKMMNDIEIKKQKLIV